MTEQEIIREEFKKRFALINEYVVNLGNNIEEDGEQDPNAAPQGGDPNMGGGAPMDGGMGGDPNMGGGAPAPDGGMGGDPNMGGMPPQGGDPNAAPQDGGQVAPPEGLDPQDPSMGGDMGMDAGMDPNAPSPEDDVVDVSELTDKEEENGEKIEHVSDKFDKVMKAIGSFEEIVRQQNDAIEELKAEYERRNPTQIEKLSMQTAKSYPFNITPEDYWKEKEATSNYSTEDDKNGVEQGQYVITKKDVDGDVNWKGIADSLDDDDLIFNQSLNNLLKY